MKRLSGVVLQLAVAWGGAWFAGYSAQGADLIIGSVNQNINSNSPFVPTDSPSQLSWATISNALSSGAVTVTTVGSPNPGSDNITIATASPVMNSTNSLIINANGALMLNSGSTIVNNGSGSLKLQGDNGVTFNANVTLTGPLIVWGAAILGSDVTVTGSTVYFSSTLDGAHNLTVNGSANLNGPVGGIQSLASMTLGNAVLINCSTINTTGNQTYNGPVTLDISTTLASSGSGNIVLAGTVNGADSLVVNTTGTTTFDEPVGSPWPLTSLTVNSPVNLNGSTINTSGDETYNGPMTLGTDTTLNTGTLELGAVNSPVNGSLSLNNYGRATLSGVMTGVSNLTASGSGVVQVNGTISPASVTVLSGATLAGNGTINAPVFVQEGGTLSPGASLGALTISNALTLGGTAFLQLNKAVPTNSLVRNLGSVAYDGTLTVTNLGGTRALGDCFYLFEAAAYSGAFALTNLPALNAGLAWNTASLGSNGSISVVIGPSSPIITNFGFTGSQFRFYLTGPVGQQVIVQASTNLPVWLPIWTNTFGAGPLFFGDSQGAIYPHRFYRAVSP